MEILGIDFHHMARSCDGFKYRQWEAFRWDSYFFSVTNVAAS